MPKILLISHGKMAEGMKDSLEMVLGESDALLVKSLKANQNIEDFREEIKDTIIKNSEDGILIFVDIFGGSPYNVSLYNYQELKDRADIKIIAGVNLPMLIEALTNASNMNLDELCKACISSGREQILDGVEFLEATKSDQIDDY